MSDNGFIAILETGVPPTGLDPAYGTYADMFSKTLATDGRAFRTYRTLEGELPEPKDGLSGVVITGSPAGVYESDPWIARLIQWLRGLNRDIPTVGICFGHQVMAQAWGGHVEKSPKGWGVGLHEYSLHDTGLWHDLLGRQAEYGSIKVAVTHQDQVVKTPENARVLAGSDFTPNGALYYTDRKAISFQCHPEFCENFASDLLISRRGVRIDPELVDQAVLTLKGESHRKDVLNVMSRFLG